MGRHTGERAAAPSPTPRPPRRRILLLAFLVTVTLVAWGVLVFAAIDLGSEARSGDSTAWKFLALAAVGAAACLFVTMILGGRLLAAVRGRQATPPRAARAPGRRVAR